MILPPAIRGWHRPLLASAALLFALALACAVGLFVDDRLLLGESVWVKPLKFGFAFGGYAVTLAWLLGRLRGARRFGWWVGAVFAVAGVLDVSAIAYAAARGTFSHFNVDTDPVARAVQTVFNVAIVPIMVAVLVVAVLVLVQRAGDRALTRALRIGLGLAVAGILVAIWLSGANGVTPRTVADANGHPVTMIGAHGVGDPDGSGMPLTHWSATGGDLRVPHFVGLHGVHALLLVTVLLGALASRLAWLRDERVRARLVGVAALGYTGVFAVLTWQARRGQSVVHPDQRTLAAFAGIAGFTLLAAGAVALLARRRPAPAGDS
ncbi:hypothetical protein R8Z50_08850 [Longispora sp. K20-0274]|uniref:hypothetical protein n=1 Tax=Longispora sp. K20-0274 TaxID=3088255 RepID=UPI00399B7C49